MRLGTRFEKKDQKKEIQEKYQVQISQLCRQKLMGYADSFQQLARSLDGKFETGSRDRSAFWDERKSWEDRQVLCRNFSEVSTLMRRMAGETFSYLPMEERRRRQLLRLLREAGYEVEDICYVHMLHAPQAVGMLLRTQQTGGKPAREVADLLMMLFHRQMQLSPISPSRVDGQFRTFFFVDRPQFIVLNGYAKVVKETETVSGDNYSFLETEQGKLSMLLSDGTGSGERAGRDSGRVLDLMEKLMEAGFPIQSAVSMVNATIFVQNDDNNHPTLDICSFDLYQGDCEIYKVGGAASFLKRGKQVEQIALQNLPLGMNHQMEIKAEHRKLQEGDYLIMLSDGVLDAFGQQNYEDTFQEILEQIQECNPGEMAEKLLHQAFLACGGHIRDDMTILVAGFWKNNRIS